MVREMGPNVGQPLKFILRLKFTLFKATPESLNPNIINPAAFILHTDFNVGRLQYLCKSITGELSALISIKYLWRAITLNGFFQGINTKVGAHGIGQPPRQDLSTMPVHNRHQINKPFSHWRVRNLSAKNLIRTINGKPL